MIQPPINKQYHKRKAQLTSIGLESKLPSQDELIVILVSILDESSFAELLLVTLYSRRPSSG